MSEAYFSKLDPQEKESRLIQLGGSKGKITIWAKGQKQKHSLKVDDYNKNRMEIVLDLKEQIFPVGTPLLCSFELRGMVFFAEVLANRSITDQFLIEFNGVLFKSEKRASYRLLTFPIYTVHAEFDIDEAYQGGKVINLKARTHQTQLFKNFLKLLEEQETDKEAHKTMKYRVQDLSATGLSLHIGEIEAQLFSKDYVFKNVKLIFSDETIEIPEVKVVYVVDFISPDRKVKKYKVGLHFVNNHLNVDVQLGQKINQLLREIDFNKDFENFTK